MIEESIETAAPRKPDPEEEPRLEDYGLSKETGDKLAKLQVRTCLTIWVIMAFLTYILLILYTIGYFNASPQPPNPRLVSQLVFYTVLFLLFGLMSIGIFSYGITRLYLRVTNRSWQKLLQYEKEYEAYRRKVSIYEDWQSRARIQFWNSLSGPEFKKRLTDLYLRLGYEISPTLQSGDQGFEISLKKNGDWVIVRCKSGEESIGPEVVKALYDTLNRLGASRAILVCPSGFTKRVFEYVQDKPLELISASDLAEMEGSVNS